MNENRPDPRLARYGWAPSMELLQSEDLEYVARLLEIKTGTVRARKVRESIEEALRHV